ncbi:MAG: histidine kinase [Firmicutes bacterium]|nr:histidine kinase [Bacillota bacterium]
MWQLFTGVRKISRISKLFNRLGELYANLRIKYKLFVINLGTILITYIISLVAAQALLRAYQSNLYNEAAKVLNYYAINLENNLKQIDRLTFDIVSNQEIQNSLIKLKNSLNDREAMKERAKLTDVLWRLTFEPHIVSINIVDRQGIQSAGGIMIPSEVVQAAVVKAREKKGGIVFLKSHINNMHLYCVRQIRQIKDLSLDDLGILILTINMRTLIQQNLMRLIDDQVDISIISGSDYIYTESNLLRQVKFTTINHSGYLIKTINKTKYFIAYVKSSYTDWCYLTLLPYQKIFSQLNLIKLIISLLYILLIILVIYLSVMMADNLVKPIEKLTQKMKIVETGEFNLKDDNEWKEISRFDEIGNLERDFMIMVDKINNLIQENYTKQLLIKDTQIRALQAKINPHFLYNTLNSINWLAKINKQNEISLMVESLANLLRNSIEDEHYLITLEEDINLLCDYINIQKIRFGDRLNFSLNINTKWRNILVPKLTLQPIVENSINYGLEEMVDVCNITVKASATQGLLRIAVEDNGPGIPPEVLDKLIKWELTPKKLGIGLKTINERLKLIYGERYNIKITSKLNKGTRVEIIIPIDGG